MTSETSDAQVYRRTADLLEADVNDELVALEPNRGLCFGFNSVATDVWRKLDRPRSLEELKQSLLADYEVSEDECERDLLELLDQMSEAKLIERVRGAAAED